MKLKVTYKSGEKRSVSAVTDTNADSTADMLQGNIFNGIYEKAGSEKKDAVKRGYASKIEDPD